MCTNPKPKLLCVSLRGEIYYQKAVRCVKSKAVPPAELVSQTPPWSLGWGGLIQVSLYLSPLHTLSFQRVFTINPHTQTHSHKVEKKRVLWNTKEGTTVATLSLLSLCATHKLSSNAWPPPPLLHLLTSPFVLPLFMAYLRT